MSIQKVCLNVDPWRSSTLIAGCLALFLLLPASLTAQESYWSVTQSSSVEIVPINVSVQNDSITLHWKILVSEIKVGSHYSHVLMPLLVGSHNSFSLPPVIISGRKRASYDLRERALDPFQRKPYAVSVYHRRRPVEPIYYSVTFPYAAWMEHCSLELRQVRESALHAVLLSSDRLCSHFLPARPAVAPRDTVRLPADTIRIVPVAPVADSRPAPDSLLTTRVALFLAYPAGFSGINALFSDNASELAKVDRLLLPLLSNPRQRIHRIRVTGYSSPDGVYIDNEQLAKKRAQEFVRYLRTAYSLPTTIPVRTAWVAEDWEGLRAYLAQSDLSYRNRALSIIDHTGLFDGRERELMNLDGGNLYRNLQHTIFPKLRRIELVVEASHLKTNE